MCITWEPTMHSAQAHDRQANRNIMSPSIYWQLRTITKGKKMKYRRSFRLRAEEAYCRSCKLYYRGMSAKPDTYA